MSEKIRIDGQDKMSIEEIKRTAIGFQESRIILTAVELDIFSALGKERRSSTEVAKSLGTDERATNRLMNALTTMGILRKIEGMFFNTEATARYLDKESPDYMAGLLHIAALWKSWSKLTQVVKKGGPAERERDEKDLKGFISAMHERAQNVAPNIVGMLDLSGVNTVLDVGGGSGAFSMAFVSSKHDIKATVFDLPDVIPLTKEYVQGEGLSDRIDVMPGDYNVDDFGSGYDLVFLSAIIHINSPEKNQGLIKKCADSLTPGGQLVVQDFIMDETRTTPSFGAIFALNMLVNTQSGDTYTESEVKDWMKNAGLKNVERKDTGTVTSLIIGRKAD
ncbi:MAG: methyltransferase [Archaeoglobaceae archaeon]